MFDGHRFASIGQWILCQCAFSVIGDGGRVSSNLEKSPVHMSNTIVIFTLLDLEFCLCPQPAPAHRQSMA